jgi:hypothetical protein
MHSLADKTDDFQAGFTPHLLPACSSRLVCLSFALAWLLSQRLCRQCDN